MFKFLKFSATLILLLPITVKAQNCGYNYLGTKTLYTAPAYKNTAVPAGYAPVFINHVGRHGARHLTKEVNTSYAWQLLMQADSGKALTATGSKLKQMVMALDKVEQGIVKSISIEGKDELQDIGKRMYAHYPQVFAGPVKLNVAITKEVRTKQSADAFLGGLKTGFKDSAAIKQITDDTDLRFYDASPTYTEFEEKGNWQPVYQHLQKTVGIAALNKRLVQKWFAPAFAKTLKPAEMDKLVSDVFGFLTILPSLRGEVAKASIKPGDLNFASLFTCDQLTALSKIDVADDYLKKGPGADVNGIQVRIAVPLLVNFINTTDAYTKNAPVNAELRFAHAETISPFATLLGISKASKVATNLAFLDANWRSSEVIPLSSNIQWIFYRKKGGDEMLVKVLLNEQDAHINGLSTATFPYYKWSAMRAFYMAKLGKLNVKLTDDMEKYLKEVK